jgi:hypothetical protein
MKKLTLILTILFLCSCGGGGGGSSDVSPEDIMGTYDIYLKLGRNTCNLGLVDLSLGIVSIDDCQNTDGSLCFRFANGTALKGEIAGRVFIANGAVFDGNTEVGKWNVVVESDYDGTWDFVGITENFVYTKNKCEFEYNGTAEKIL